MPARRAHGGASANTSENPAEAAPNPGLSEALNAQCYFSMAAPSVAVGQHIAVELHTYNGSDTLGSMTVEQANSAARAKRALLTLGGWWVAAVISALVPFAHWVLVPTLFLLGPVMAAFALSRDRVVRDGVGTCPTCAAAVTFAGASRPESFSTTCPACGLTITITVVVDSRRTIPGAAMTGAADMAEEADDTTETDVATLAAAAETPQTHSDAR